MLMEVGKEMYISFRLHYCELSAQKFCVILSLALQFVPITQHHIHNIAFCTTDRTKTHSPALSTVCTYRVLLSLIVFVLYSAICSSIQIKNDRHKTLRSHSTVPRFCSMFLDETQTLCKYVQNS